MTIDYRLTPAIPPYTPYQYRTAYNFSDCYLGQGQTVAIVVAFGNPNLMSDLNTFNTRFDLPPVDIEIVYPQGEPSMTNEDWIIETSMDVELCHALAPCAKILLVVAIDESMDNLLDAARFASQTDASVISMSWGFTEFQEEVNFDSIFETPGKVFIASSGDGFTPEYPASSPRVISVGGTSLQLDPLGNQVAPEIGWILSGGGISLYEQKPPWQYIPSSAKPPTGMRTTPDVSFFADLFPGTSIFATINPEPAMNWFVVGGTSVGAPCWAAIFACAIPGGLALLDATPLIYELGTCSCSRSKEDIFRDITNGNTMFFPAIPGYDYVTGLGSPNVSAFIEAIRRKGCFLKT